MKKVILVGIHGRESMKKVFTLMTNEDVKLKIRVSGKNCMIVKEFKNNNSEIAFAKKSHSLSLMDSVCVRWGNRIVTESNNSTIVYNKSCNITNAVNKKAARQLFIENKVSCPKLFTDNTDLTYPIIARPNTHSKGRDVVILNNRSDFLKHYLLNRLTWYYSEFIDKDREFRVYCAHGKVLAITEKPKGDGVAWNRAVVHESWKIVKQADWIHDLALQSLRAVKSLGLDFGGVDVMLKDDKAYVCEVNTAPTINIGTVVNSRFAKYFDWLFKQDTRREHWDFEKYKETQSFAWKLNRF